MKTVNYYEPGKAVPSIQIKAVFRHQSSASDSVPELFYQLALKGIQEPNIITVDIDPSLSIIDSQCTFQAGLGTCTCSHNRCSLIHHLHACIILYYMHVPYCIIILIHAGVSVELQEIMLNTGIRKEDLNNKVTDENVRRFASKFADYNWLECAITLGLDESERRAIRTDVQLDSEFLKAHEMLQMWHKRNGYRATYRILVDACCSHKNMRLAMDLCHLLKQYNLC